MADETEDVESVPIHSNDPLLSSEDRLKLNELMELCTNLSQRVLDLENTKTSQAAEINKLKEKVKKLERRSKSRTPGLKRLKKVGRSAQVVFSEDIWVAQRNAPTRRKLKLKSSSTAKPYYKHTVDELTLAQTLIEIKAAKPKVVTTAATTTTTVVTRPKARGVVVQEPKVAEGSKKRIREELEFDNSNKQKIDENIEAKVDGEAEMKKLYGDKGKMGYFQIIRADGSSRRYSSTIRMFQNIDREDLETLFSAAGIKVNAATYNC
ncbi:hypothetical protein Tco_1332294 [Tanacetum coccineum]